MGRVRENELLGMSDFLFYDLLILTRDYFPNLQPGVDRNCYFLFWGGRRGNSKLEFVGCVRENELLRISDFLFCDLLILPIDYFPNLQPGVDEKCDFLNGGGTGKEVIQSVILWVVLGKMNFSE